MSSTPFPSEAAPVATSHEATDTRHGDGWATICLFAVFIHTLFPYTEIGALEFSTHLSWLLQVGVLVYLFRRARRESQIPRFPRSLAIHLFAALLVVHTLVGITAVETYWDLKGLVNNALALGFFVIVYVGSNVGFLSSVAEIFLYRLAPAAVVFALVFSGLILDDAAIGYSLILSSLLLSLGRYLRPRDLLLALLYGGCVFVLDLGSRSNVLKVAFPLLVLVTLGPITAVLPRLGRMLGRGLMWSLVAAPVAFFALAANGTFNVFAPEWIPDDLTVSQRAGEGVVEEVRKTDTRTFIYLEVLASAEEKDSFAFGTTPARGYISSFFGVQDENERGERLRSEVGVLNVFTWFGVLGVVLFYALFIQGLFLAAYRSRNSAGLFLAIFSAFNLSYSWVENFTALNLPNLTIWLALGLCYSPALRAMTDDEVRQALSLGRSGAS